MTNNKPIKAKPIFYAHVYEALKKIAMDMGYNLLIHGSLDRDLDLVAITWSDDAKPMESVVIAFDEYLTGSSQKGGDIKLSYLYKVLPGGRHSYVINLNRGGRWNNYMDEQWYLDISFVQSLPITP